MMNLLTQLHRCFFRKGAPHSGFFFVRWLGIISFLYALQLLARLVFLGLLGHSNLWLETCVEGWKMDLSMVGYWTILLGMVTLLPTSRWSKWVWGLVWFLVLEVTLMTAVSDASFWVLWGTRFNAQTLYFLQFPAECIASLSVFQLLGALALTLILAWLSRLLSRRLFPQQESPKLRLLTLLLVGFVAARGGLGTTPLQASACLYSPDALRNVAASNSSWNLFFVLTQQQYKPDLSLWTGESEDHGYWPTDSPTDSLRLSSKENPHVLLFIMESFSAELSAAFSSGKGLIQGESEMPFLDSLARVSLSFSRTYAAGDRTDKGLAAILAGYPGQVWQSLLNEPERFSRYKGLAQSFADKGYATSFWYGGDGEFSNTSAFARSMGHQLCQDERSIRSSYERDKWGLSDRDVLMEMELYLEAHHGRPQYLTWLSLSSHEPYRVAELDAQYQFEWSEMQRYRSAIRYSDQALRDFFKRNAEKKWFQESLIVVIADHGRDIETGYTYVGQEAFFHIPWLISGPALHEDWRSKQITTICSQTDVGNTLLSGLWGQTSLLPYSRNALSKNHPHCAAWHTERRLGWIDLSGSMESQIGITPSPKFNRLKALENQLWQAMEKGEL